MTPALFAQARDVGRRLRAHDPVALTQWVLVGWQDLDTGVWEYLPALDDRVLMLASGYGAPASEVERLRVAISNRPPDRLIFVQIDRNASVLAVSIEVDDPRPELLN